MVHVAEHLSALQWRAAVVTLTRPRGLLLAPVALLALLLAGIPCAARADVDADHPLLDSTGYTLRAHEVQLGVLQSSFGVTDRLQLDSFLLADLVTFINLGAKLNVVRAPNLAVAVEAWGGVLPAALLLSSVLYDWGVQADASVPLVDALTLHVSAGYRYWRFSGLGFVAGTPPFDGRVAWPSVQAELEYDLTPIHILFLTAGTPTAWQTAVNSGVHDFDATDFWSVTVGYQLSYKIFNLRLNAGYGPGLLGRGLVGSADLYFRFGG